MLGPLVLGAIERGGWMFCAVMLVVFLASAWEWLQMTVKDEPRYVKATALASLTAAFGVGMAYICVLWTAGQAASPPDIRGMAEIGLIGLAPIGASLIAMIGFLLIARWAGKKALWIGLGVPYVALACWALLGLRLLPDNGKGITFYLLTAVWATDIGAFLAGRLIGGPKLCPAISPKKTWAGLIGGMALAGLIGYGVSRGFGMNRPEALAGLAVGLAVVAQIGDFFESWMKRRAGVKDSGTIIPGHGGILDRIDGLMFAAVALAAIKAVMSTAL